jgi:hypothetical protein
MKLYALERDNANHCDYVAAPSLEAAAAACTEPGDSVRVWIFDAEWHAESVRCFLEFWMPQGEAS